MRTYNMSVPLEQHDAYMANGWIFKGMDREHAARTLVYRTLNVVGDGVDSSHTIGQLTKPTHLQTAVIRRPLGRYRDARFFESVSLDHMSPTFQKDHTLIESLRRIKMTEFAYDIFKAENLFLTKENRSYALRLYTRFRGKELEQYVSWLLEVRASKIKLAADSKFSRRVLPDNELPKDADLWWDICNDVIFSFDKNYMNRLLRHLEVSYSIMDGTYAGASILRSG